MALQSPPRLTPCCLPVLIPGVEQRSRVFAPGRIAVHEIMAYVSETLDAWHATAASMSAARALSELLCWLLHNEPCHLGIVATVWIDRPLVFIDLSDRSSVIPDMGPAPSPTDYALCRAMTQCAEDWGAEVILHGRCLWASFHI